MSDDALVAEAVGLARELAAEARAHDDRRARRRSRRMARLVEDPAGLPMALALTDEVMRIRDHRRSAERFAEVVGAGVPPTLPLADRVALRAGAALAPRLPSLVMPLVRRRVKAETAGLVIPAIASWASGR